MGNYLLSIYGAFLLFSALESCKSTSKAFQAWFMLFSVITAVMFVGLAVPLFWLPSFWCFPNLKGHAHPTVLLIASACAIAIIYLAKSTLHASSDGDLNFYLISFHIALFFLQCLWFTAAKFLPTNTFHASATTIYRIYSVASLVSGTLWISFFSAYTVFLGGNALFGMVALGEKIWEVLSSSSGDHVNLSLLLLDAIFLWVSLLFWIFCEMGITEAAKMLAWSVIIGPGAAFLKALLAREDNLLRAHLQPVKNKLE